MQYRKDRFGNDISMLGYGCMRFTKKGIGTDMEKTEAEILRAVELGINYFDTAYIYPGSENSLGQILAKNNLRSKVNIATKLPQYLIRNSESIEKYFIEQLSRLQTDYIDYYLMHMLTDIDAWNTLKKIGIEEWIKEKKSQGKIRQIGFSFHGDSDMFLKILNAYDWDFCQIQYNYMDREEQAGDKGVALATEKGIPLVIMEPIKGGTLAVLPDEVMEPFRAIRPDASAASWALRFVASRPIIKVILSGMSAEEQVADNLNTFTNYEPMTEEELAAVDEVTARIRARVRNGCTGCRYCMPCPNGVDIPRNFSVWNKFGMYANVGSTRWDWSRIPDDAKAKNCVECGACEAACPQHLSIRENLATLQAELDAATAE